MLNEQAAALLRSEPLVGPNKVRRAMVIADVTQEQMAKDTGIRQPQISAIVRGRYQKLPLETARTLARYFGVDIEDLFPAQEREALAS